jgi:transposase
MFRTREQLVNQRTELVNALLAHLYEFGHIAPQGIRYLNRLECFVEDENANLPDLAREICRDLLDRIYQLTGRIDALKKKVDALSKEAEASRRLQTMPALAPSPHWRSKLSRRRWRRSNAAVTSPPGLGSSRCRNRPAASNDWEKPRRWANAIFDACSSLERWLSSDGSWLARMMAKKPRMLVAIALANKMARGIWAMLTKEEDYRNPATVSA